MQEGCNSTALAMELHLSYIDPLIWKVKKHLWNPENVLRTEWKKVYCEYYGENSPCDNRTTVDRLPATANLQVNNKYSQELVCLDWISGVLFQKQVLIVGISNYIPQDNKFAPVLEKQPCKTWLKVSQESQQQTIKPQQNKAPLIARSPATMILTMWDKQVLVFGLPSGKFLITCNILVLRNDRKCKDIFMFPQINSAWKS